MKFKIDKTKYYNAVFEHCMDDEDRIETGVYGKLFFRTRNMLLDLGYLVKSVEEIKD